MSDKITKYIVSTEVAESLDGLILDSMDIVEKAKKMLNSVSTYKIGSIGDIPVYVSDYARENEVMVMKKDIDLPTGPIFVPQFKLEE